MQQKYIYSKNNRTVSLWQKNRSVIFDIFSKIYL